MFKIIKAHDPKDKQRLEEEIAAVDFSQESAILLRFSRGAEEIAVLQHDLSGALRSFRYLAEKVKQGYDQSDQRGQRMLASIDRHVDSLNKLKEQLDQILEH